MKNILRNKLKQNIKINNSLKKDALKASLIFCILIITHIINFSFILSSLIGISVGFGIFYLSEYYDLYNIKTNDLIKKVKVYKNNVFVTEYEIPEKIKRKYYRLFGKQPALNEEDFLSFMSTSLSSSELIEYFSVYKRKADDFYSKISKVKDKNHLSSNQSYHISYYEGNNIKVITELNGEPITEENIKDFNNYVSLYKNKGDKYVKDDLDNWLNSKKDI